MNIYKVDAKGNYFAKRFISAPDRKSAIEKFLEIHSEKPSYHDDITIELICKRDEIVPTVEPIKEYYNAE